MHLLVNPTFVLCVIIFLPFCKEIISLHKILTCSSNLDDNEIFYSTSKHFSSYKEKREKFSEEYLLKSFSSLRVYSHAACKSIMPFCKMNIAMSLGRDYTYHSSMMSVEGLCFSCKLRNSC